VTEPRELRFREVVLPSGHSTLRLIIYDEKEVSTISALLAVLKPILDEGEAQERWGYEEACLPST
jgi:hypothetical protein